MGLGAILGLAKPLVTSIGGVIDDLHTSQEEKDAAKLAVEQLATERFVEIEKTYQDEIKAKQKIIVAEMQSGDNFTRRARPSIVYAGMLLIVFNYGLLPWLARFSTGVEAAPIVLPPEFWVAWGSVVSIWSIGRTAEKRGNGKNKLVRAIRG